jgi:glycopeptide antibiotics resistance protein
LRRILLGATLALYLLTLLLLTLWAFPQPAPPPNLIPFRSISGDLDAGGRRFAVNFLGNILAFLPLGCLLPALHRLFESAGRVALASFLLSGGIESLQYLSGRRVADIDDLLLNTSGGALGFVAFLVARSAWRAVTVPDEGPDLGSPPPPRILVQPEPRTRQPA